MVNDSPVNPPQPTVEEVLGLTQALLDFPQRQRAGFDIDGCFYLQFFDNNVRSSFYELRQLINGTETPRQRAIGGASANILKPGISESTAVLVILQLFADIRAGRPSAVAQSMPEFSKPDLVESVLVEYFARPGEDASDCLGRLESAWATAHELASNLCITEGPSILGAAIWGEGGASCCLSLER